MDSGWRVFYGSRERNPICWTALMSSYVSNGRLEQALRSVVWMQQERYRPDVVTVATVIPVCAKFHSEAWKGDTCFCCQAPVLA